MLPVASYNQPGRNSGRLVNVYPRATAAKGPVELLGCPGVTTVETLSGGGRGLHVNNGVLYAVAGNALYSMSNDQFVSRGTLPGGGLLTFASNDLGEIVFSNNYWWDGSSVAELTDIDTPRFGSVDYCEGFIVATEEGTDKFYSSGLRDAASWDGLDFGQPVSFPGDLVRLIVDHTQVLLFKETGVEIWWMNSGAGFPFARISNGTIELGCLARNAVVKADNSVFWLASDRTIRRLTGSTPVKVSKAGVEEKLASYATVSDAQAFTITWQGEIWVVFRFPSENATWVYSCTSGEWHERESYHRTAWDVVASAPFNGKVYVQHANGSIGVLADVHTEFGQVLRREVTWPNLYQGNAMQFPRQFDAVFRSGYVPAGTVPMATLEVSKDGGSIFHALPVKERGRTGEYTHVTRWNRLGSGRDMVFRLSSSDAAEFILSDAVLV